MPGQQRRRGGEGNGYPSVGKGARGGAEPKSGNVPLSVKGGSSSMLDELNINLKFYGRLLLRCR